MEEIKVLPIRVRVTAALRKALLSGEFAAGQELSLTQVAADLGVSRTPVREAFQALAAEGLLDLRMNKGAIVVGINEKYVQDHFALRILLECEAVRLACRNHIRLAPLLALQEQAEASSSATSEAEYRSYNQKLHTAFWEAADNQKLFGLLMSLWNGPSGGSIGRDLAHEAQSIAEHRRILNCLAAQDADGAAAVMEAHLSRSRDNILLSFRKHHAGKEETGC